jgi:hypothetical protein
MFSLQRYDAFGPRTQRIGSLPPWEWPKDLHSREEQVWCALRRARPSRNGFMIS